MEGFLVLGGVENERRTAMVDAHEIRSDPWRIGSGVFLQPYDLLDDRQSSSAKGTRPIDPRPASLEQATLPSLVKVDRFSCIKRAAFARRMRVQPVAALGAEAYVIVRKAQMHGATSPELTRTRPASKA